MVPSTHSMSPVTFQGATCDTIDPAASTTAPHDRPTTNDDPIERHGSFG